MPFNYAHALLAIRAAEEAGPAASALARAYPRAFRAGAMGPDPYFADTMPKPLLKKSRAELADRMHGLDARALFSAFLACAASGVQRAYTLGMLCHFALDVHAHPYICARFPGRLHTPGEMHMDLPFADRMQEPLLAARPSAFFRISPKELDEIDALHAAVVRALWHENSRGAFSRSYRKWVYLVNRLSFDPHGRKLRFFTVLERLIRKPGIVTARLVTRDPLDGARDLMNLAHAPWAAPWAPDVPRSEAFPELFDAALTEAAALLCAAAEGFSSDDFSGALDIAGRRCMNGNPVL